MRNIAGLLILTSFVSCSKINDVFYRHDNPDRKSTHADFKPYLQVLEADVGNVHIPVIYGNAADNENWVGKCTKWTRSSYREITIDRDYWSKASDSAKYQLLLHEIGHCKFDRGHEDSHSDSCPVSIMRSWVFSQSELFHCFDVKFNYYISRLLGDE
jgi:hypothetical protein